MNQEALMRYRNEIASYVKSFHIKRNVINLNVHNSPEHEMIKSRICYELKKENKHFFTEVPLRSRYKKEIYADILVLDTAQIIEVMVSETLEQVRYKTDKYPTKFTIIAVTDWEQVFNGSYTLIREGLFVE